MPRVLHAVRLLLIAALCCAASAPAHAQTGPGREANQQTGGTDDSVAETPPPETNDETEAPEQPARQPAQQQQGGNRSSGLGLPGIPGVQQAKPANGAPGQPEGEALPDAMKSPRGSVELFINEARAALTTRDAEVDILLKYLPQRIREAFDNAGLRDARRLGQVVLELYDRDPSLLRLYSLKWDDAGALAEWRIDASSALGDNALEYNLPLVKGERGYWRFSEEALTKAGRLHGVLFPDEYFLRSAFENLGLTYLVNREILDVGLYQWVALGALIVLVWLLDLFIAVTVQFLIKRYYWRGAAGRAAASDSEQRAKSEELVRKTAKPLGLAVAGAVFYVSIPLLNMPTRGEGVLRVAAQVLALFGGFLALSRTIDLVSEWFQRRALSTSTKFDDLLVPLLRKSAKTILFAVALLTVAESLDLPITSLIAGLGIAGAAIAFASKDTVENFFGSVAVILDRPFNAGDFVSIDGTDGIVEHLGFRSTRIRTFYNSLVTVPNALLVRAKVDNYGMRKFRRYTCNLSLLYSTPPDRIEAFCEGLRDLVRNHPDTRKDQIEIHFRDFGSHSLDIFFYIFFRVPDWAAELAARHEINLQILRLAKRIGVEFAYPTQTLEIRRADPLDEPGPVIAAKDAREEGAHAATDIRKSKLLD